MFIAVASLAMMAATAPSADAVGNGRKDFTKCLSAQVKPAMDAKMSTGDFQASLKKVCATQEAAFRAAIIAQDKADKMSDSASASDADDQIGEYVDKITSEYEESSHPG